ncbi:MAG: DinB family protein [Anaerolineaceae bacterium]|nr:DinB family protein [Anaerolineaceae bacterium]
MNRPCAPRSPIDCRTPIDLPASCAQFARQADAIHALAAGANEAQSRWRPDAESWSLLEVINHLADEEGEDFRARLDLLLHRPADPWPAIDPQGWVRSRAYNERDLAASLARFREARADSLAWLRGLHEPAWDNSAPTPWGGRLRGADLLAAWLAHDLLHLRQLVELQYAWLAEHHDPQGLDYAGDW